MLDRCPRCGLQLPQQGVVDVVLLSFPPCTRPSFSHASGVLEHLHRGFADSREGDRDREEEGRGGGEREEGRMGHALTQQQQTASSVRQSNSVRRPLATSNPTCIHGRPGCRTATVNGGDVRADGRGAPPPHARLLPVYFRAPLPCPVPEKPEWRCVVVVVVVVVVVAFLPSALHEHADDAVINTPGWRTPTSVPAMPLESRRGAAATADPALAVLAHPSCIPVPGPLYPRPRRATAIRNAAKMP